MVAPCVDEGDHDAMGGQELSDGHEGIDMALARDWEQNHMGYRGSCHWSSWLYCIHTYIYVGC